MELFAETAMAPQGSDLVRVFSHLLREGEQFAEPMRLQAGLTYTVVIEGWERIEAVSLRLVDEDGNMLPPEVDEDLVSLHFAPHESGTYQLRVILEAIAGGEGPAEVGAVVRQKAAHLFTDLA